MASQKSISVPDLQEIQQEFSPIVHQAQALEIATIQQHEGGLLLLKSIRSGQKAIHERVDPIVKQAHGLHKSLTTLRKDALATLEDAEAIVTGKLDYYEKEAKQQLKESLKKAMENPDDMSLVPEALAKVDGISTTTRYKARVMDIVLALEHMTANHEEISSKMWIALADTLEKELGPLVRAQRDSFRFPGVKVIVESGRSVRTA